MRARRASWAARWRKCRRLEGMESGTRSKAREADVKRQLGEWRRESGGGFDEGII